jgi:RNA-directed DNA polymerase
VRLPRATYLLIFAKDKETAGNYKAYATKILEEELKLKVNQKKTKLTSVREGFRRRITKHAHMGAVGKTLEYARHTASLGDKRHQGERL